MAPPIVQATTTEALMGTAAWPYALARAAAGWHPDRIADTLASWNPWVPARAWAGLVGRAELGLYAGERLEAAGNASVPRSNIPVNLTLPPGTAYRVHLRLTVRRGAGREEHIPVTVDWGHNPTGDEVRRRFARVEAPVLREQLRSYPLRGEQRTYGEVQIHGVEIEAIERRTY